MKNDTGRLNDVATEQELLDLFGIKKTALDDLRYRHQLPFCKVTKNSRVYFVEDVLKFLQKRRTILNQEAR
jgi:hypothetical protein